MRPIKDLFVEEYWNIGFRSFRPNDSIVNSNGVYCFDSLKKNKRYWYADPFLFETNGKTYLFTEAFDNKTEKGLIACSEFVNGAFTKPKIVIEEKYHLSFPFVFEKDGQVFMMPETRENDCIQLFVAEDFPYKWKKNRIIIDIKDAVDTVLFGDILLTSKITAPTEMKTQLERYDFYSGCSYGHNPAKKESQLDRGAGKIFQHNGQRIRPAQNCSGAIYGKGLVFYRIERCSEECYSEEIFSEVDKNNLKIHGAKPYGLHTYARTDKIEIVDFKSKRLNFRRLLWIIMKKI